MMMSTSGFDAVVDFPPRRGKGTIEAMILFGKSKETASVSFYELTLADKEQEFFVRIQTRKPVMLCWGDRFRVRQPKAKTFLGKGRVLNPHSEKVRGKKIKKRIAFLHGLLGDEKDMLAALVQEKGIKGLREKEAVLFSGLRRARLLSLSKSLEAKGELRILSFSPLILISKKSFDHLCQKILAFLSSFHEKHPEEQGAPVEKIRKRFDTDQKTLALAYSRLAKEHKIRLLENALALSSFERVISPQEEKILRQMEKMCYIGEFRSVSTEDLRHKFHLTPAKLNLLLDLLIERKKIVQGKEGFLIHSKWLDDVIFQIQASGKKELTVSEFKTLTGLSRKYAIPLLELLDQMGVTRRKGPKREVL